MQQVNKMGKKIACIGGGQLAQMLGEAATPLGIDYRSAGAEGSCAFSTCEAFTHDLNDEKQLDAFLSDVDVFTFESEHEGVDFAERIAQRGVPIFPSAEFVGIAGDRYLEKTLLDSNTIPVAPWSKIPTDLSTVEELESWLELRWKNAANGIVIKTQRGGYDGKGQWTLTDDRHAEDVAGYAQEIFPLLDIPGCIVEDRIDFEFECSILAARSISGEIATWPLTHNIHKDSILRKSYSPITTITNIDELEQQAIDIVTTLCTNNNYVGTIAVECFVTPNGLVVNEIAPRVHNSGHWTIEGSQTSQFEQHSRAIVGMELGDTTTSGYASMINLIGRSINPAVLEGIDGVFFHWYGKEVKPGRKVGHITIVAPTPEQREDLTNNVEDIINMIGE